MWFGLTMPVFSGNQWVVPLFSVFIVGYGELPFLQMTMPELRNRKPGMMALISLAISVIFGYSLLHKFFRFGESFFWELVRMP